MTHKALLRQLQISCLGLDAVDPLRLLVDDVIAALAQTEQDHIPDARKMVTEQEPVAWLLTDKNINSLQVDSIQRLINRLNHAHHTDLCVRINGQDEWFEADWLKHLTRTTPPQRSESSGKPSAWVGLTDEDIDNINYTTAHMLAREVEAKLKEKNT